MADLANNTDGLQKPAGTPTAKQDVIIHVIPEKFHGAALKKKLPKEKPAVAAPAAAGAPGSAAARPAPTKKRSKVLLIGAIVAAVLLLGGVAAFFLVRPSEPAPPIVAGPMCGNGVCEAGESTASCPLDCPAPVPVCGNAVCEEGETPNNCSADCGAPPSVCGNDICEADETVASCPADCRPPAPVCGNATCEEGETVASCPADCRAPEPVPGTDMDSDGLTDLEERSIYQTDPRNPDSDGDSFVDLNEVLNLFDPADPLPMTLANNPGITVHTDTLLDYEIFRPTAWTVGVGAQGQTRFTAATGEHVDVFLEPLAQGDTLLDWYRAKDPAAASAAVIQRTRQGYEMIAGADRMAFFILAGDRVVSVAYDLSGAAFIQYRVTVEMMANSFRSVAAAQ